MRQAERVLAYPGADKVIVELLRYGEASDAFFLAMPRADQIGARTTETFSP
jgi:hypothetical protein